MDNKIDNSDLFGPPPLIEPIKLNQGRSESFQRINFSQQIEESFGSNSISQASPFNRGVKVSIDGLIAGSSPINQKSYQNLLSENNLVFDELNYSENSVDNSQLPQSPPHIQGEDLHVGEHLNTDMFKQPPQHPKKTFNLDSMSIKSSKKVSNKHDSDSAGKGTPENNISSPETMQMSQLPLKQQNSFSIKELDELLALLRSKDAKIEQLQDEIARLQLDNSMDNSSKLVLYMQQELKEKTSQVTALAQENAVLQLMVKQQQEELVSLRYIKKEISLLLELQQTRYQGKLSRLCDDQSVIVNDLNSQLAEQFRQIDQLKLQLNDEQQLSQTYRLKIDEQKANINKLRSLFRGDHHNPLRSEAQSPLEQQSQSLPMKMKAIGRPSSFSGLTSTPTKKATGKGMKEFNVYGSPQLKKVNDYHSNYDVTLQQQTKPT